MSHGLDALRQDSILQEYHFESQTPLIGPFIARFRSAWHNVAGKWAIRFIAQQQTTFNQRLLMELNNTQEYLALSDQDWAELTRTVAELTQQVIQLQHAMASLQAHRGITPAAHQGEADA